MVLLILLCLVVVVAGGVSRYLYVDRPAALSQAESRLLMQGLLDESRKSQRELERQLREAKATTETLRLNLEQMRSEIQLAKAPPEPPPEPARKVAAGPDPLVERQRLERAKAIDELVDSLTPNLQVRFQPKVTWLERGASFDFSLTNAGRRSVGISKPRITLTLQPAYNGKAAAPVPKPDEVQIDVCAASVIAPGETVNCSVLLRSAQTFTGVGSIPFQASISARTDLPPNSETWKTARSAYKEAYLESRTTKTVAFNGELWR